MIICVVGVFIDIVVIIVVLIVLVIGKKVNFFKFSILLVMIGGGKVGNIILFNFNIIVVLEVFKVDLISLMV